MTRSTIRRASNGGPKRRHHHSFDDGVNESAPTIETETTDMQADVASDGNEPIERPEPDRDEEPPAFTE